jgi:Tfp pilus assembly protein PilW
MKLIGLGIGLGLLLVATSAQADDYYRKCSFKVMVAGEGLAATEVPGATFTAWARSGTKQSASRRVNDAAAACLKKAFKKSDPGTLPKLCRDNPNVHRAGVLDQGVSGFRLTRARTALKRTICRNHRVANRRVKTMKDTRTIQSLRVFVQKTSGTGSCHNRNVIDPREVVIECRGNGRDRKKVWSFKP